MEDSRKGKRDGEKKLSTPSPHVDDEKGKKKPWYIRRRKEKGRWTENYSKIIALGHVRGDSLLELRL